jgi:hypothetical protein
VQRPASLAGDGPNNTPLYVECGTKQIETFLDLLPTTGRRSSRQRMARPREHVQHLCANFLGYYESSGFL